MWPRPQTFESLNGPISFWHPQPPGHCPASSSCSGNCVSGFIAVCLTNFAALLSAARPFYALLTHTHTALFTVCLALISFPFYEYWNFHSPSIAYLSKEAELQSSFISVMEVTIFLGFPFAWRRINCWGCVTCTCCCYGARLITAKSAICIMNAPQTPHKTWHNATSRPEYKRLRVIFVEISLLSLYLIETRPARGVWVIIVQKLSYTLICWAATCVSQIV